MGKRGKSSSPSSRIALMSLHPIRFCLQSSASVQRRPSALSQLYSALFPPASGASQAAEGFRCLPTEKEKRHMINESRRLQGKEPRMRRRAPLKARSEYRSNGADDTHSIQAMTCCVADLKPGGHAVRTHGSLPHCGWFANWHFSYLVSPRAALCCHRPSQN
ncbi:hypothetical protein DPEC_G00336440 [Dallia pectoralis]|uniref:Uncharacterized protein n=1 Tax=Dallia pectoralis TaxID=75939 RepID=A0ACC2F743_DALPE|nr:hypothetical protein DPEC_G00336440 [Dallia pectoralis]